MRRSLPHPISEPDVDQPTPSDLMRRAREAREHAYAPYSHFPVGAALLAEDGTVYVGCNVENASFGLTNCAERVAIGAAVARGARRFTAVAVSGPRSAPGLLPCGACRQVLAEFGPEMTVWVEGPDDQPQPQSLRSLIPGAFSADRLAG